MHETDLDVPADHPAFAGHFPGRPVVPAVVLLAETLAAIAAQSARPAHRWIVSSAKFLRAVGPGAPLTLAHEVLDSGQVRFEIRSRGAPVAQGQLAPAP